MSKKKPYKHQKRGQSAFVQLDHWLLKSDAWRALSPTARALYVELKMNFNGTNNGKIYLSHRDAEKRLNVSRPTVAKAFLELKEKGFIRTTRKHFLGSDGKGQAAHNLLTELAFKGKPASKEFMQWRACESC